jgi:putative ABC transport system permease protein
MAVLQQFLQDLRYAGRNVRRSPGFAALITVTLAVGIGGSTAVFSVVNTVLLRQPPYADPARLVTLHERFPKLGDVTLGTAPAEYLDYRDRSRSFSAIAGYEDAVFDLTGGAEALHIEAQRVTHSLFTTLGSRPLLGRTFSAAEDQPGGAQVAILSYQLWQRQFGGNPRALGTVVRLNEQPYTVIGVMPAGFEFPATAASVGEPPALWVPMAFTAQRIQDRASEFPVHIVARLAKGVSLAAAQQDVERVASDFQRDHRDIYSADLTMQVWLDGLGAADVSRARPVLVALAAAVFFVLLIACANVMNLLLARAVARQREMAVRNALGAGTGRLAAQLLTEGLVFALSGGALGCLLAEALIRAVASLWPSFVSGLGQVRIDSGVLAFTVALSVLTGLLCSLAPALNWRRREIFSALKQAGRQGASQQRHGLSAALVVFEAASAVVLLIGAGLLIHSLLAVLRVPMGFSPEGVLIARSRFNPQRYSTPERRHTAERQMVERLSALPGVKTVALTTHIPLADEREIGFYLEGEDFHSARWADNALVSGNYFAAMGIPLISGRTFGPEDTPQSPLAAIVNQSMARRFWPRGDAVGKRIRWGGRNLTIVGVVGDVHIKAIDAGVNPTIYNCVYQIESGATSSAVFVLRTRNADPAALASAVRAAILAVDRDVPVFDIRTMEQVVSRSLSARRFAMALLTGFAALALALAVVGLYGVLSHAVAQRTSELGLRLALGATPTELVRLVLGRGLRLTALGVVIGACGGAAAARALAGLLFGIHAFDTAAFAGAAALLLTVALVASYLPARRASRVDPVIALRQE